MPRRGISIRAAAGRFVAALVLVVAAVAAIRTGLDAPATAAPASCQRPYSDASPWNTPIGPAPTVHPNSDVHVAELDGVLSSDPTQYTYPVYHVTRRTPRSPVSISGWYSRVTHGGRRLTNQRRGVVYMPIPAAAAPARGDDAQIVLVDRSTGDEWGAFQLRRDEDGSWSATNGYRYNIRWSGVPPTQGERKFIGRGAGVPYLAGLIRPCEIARGRIDHAIAFGYDYPTRAYVYPATKSDGDSRDPADMPEGTRLQLDPSLTARQLRERGCEGACLTIARALQRYGMYVIDNVGRPKVLPEYEGTARWRSRVDAKTVRPIPLSAFSVLTPPRPPRPSSVR